jgi:hypothetical protein
MISLEKLAAAAALCLLPGRAWGQGWNTSGSNITCSSCNVGIGTATPAAALDVNAVDNFAVAGKFGPSLPVYLFAANPGVGFNMTWDGTHFAFGAGSANNYAGAWNFNPQNGNLYWMVSTLPGNAN